MTKRNPYLQHTYESFDQPVPQRRQQNEERFTDRVLSPGIIERFRSPLFATAALLLTGAALAAIIVISYPDSKAPEENLPIVTADATSFRETPTEPGGMDVPHQDSTIYSSIRANELQETPPIENLLAAEEPVDTAKAFPTEETPTAAPSEIASTQPAAGETSPAAATTITDEATPPSEMADASAEIKEAGKIDMPDLQIAEVRNIPMKTEKIPPGVSPDKPALAPAASSPETLAYVRSVLDNKETTPSAQTPSADVLAKVEPAAGATTAGAAIKPGNYFVQLASISSESAAPKEWTKLQKSFSSLSEVKYRVERADLPKGVFYRIQAGPMSKDSAKSVCDSIKAQKPGGCIIVQ